MGDGEIYDLVFMEWAFQLNLGILFFWFWSMNLLVFCDLIFFVSLCMMVSRTRKGLKRKTYKNKNYFEQLLDEVVLLRSSAKY